MLHGKSVSIRGGGVAASCAAALLKRSGIPVSATRGRRPTVPAVLLGLPAQKLLADVFQRSDLLDRTWSIRTRVVSWGKQPIVSLPHSGLVISEQDLFSEMACEESDAERADPGFTLYTESPAAPNCQVHAFGSRRAASARVTLAADADARACYTESLEEGWLFLLPTAGYTAWLLSVGVPVAEGLAQSKLIIRQVASIEGEGGSFPCYPRIADPLSGSDWLACGSAAMAFDPLCGDGVGHAVREAILATAAIRHVNETGDLSALGHYQIRLWAGFHRHLQVCREFYAAGNSGPWWDAEREALQSGLKWLSRCSMPVPMTRLRLNGFTLERVL